MTYKENVLKVAQEMAPAMYSDYNQRGEQYWELCVLWCMTHAHIAVRLQSEAVINALDINGFTRDAIDRYLIERGLIPAPCNHAFQYIDDVPKAVCTICGASEEINSPSNEQK